MKYIINIIFLHGKAKSQNEKRSRLLFGNPTTPKISRLGIFLLKVPKEVFS